MSEWKTMRLADLCTDFRSAIVDGPFGSNLKREHFQKIGVPVLKIQNVKTFKIVEKKMDYVSPEKAHELRRHSFRRGDIIMTKLGSPLGVSAIVDQIESGIIVADLVRIRADKIDTKFLCYQLNSPVIQRRINEQQKGATRPRVQISMVRDLPINIPPEGEQRRIVAVLDEAFGAIAAAREKLLRQLGLTDDLMQSFLQFAFTSEIGKGDSSTTAVANDNFKSPEFSAQILAFAYDMHVSLNRQANFGHKKAQKTLHAVEAIGGIDIGRQPIKDAAGPNDFQHMLAAETWAKARDFFEFVQRPTGGYDFHRLGNYENLLVEAKQAVGSVGVDAKRAIELLTDMDSEFAELVVTTHAAWNDLIQDQGAIPDDAIVQAARDDWHKDKLRFDKSRFHDAIRFIRKNRIVPDGSAKRVGGQESLGL